MESEWNELAFKLSYDEDLEIYKFNEVESILNVLDDHGFKTQTI